MQDISLGILIGGCISVISFIFGMYGGYYFGVWDATNPDDDQGKDEFSNTPTILTDGLLRDDGMRQDDPGTDDLKALPVRRRVRRERTDEAGGVAGVQVL